MKLAASALLFCCLFFPVTQLHADPTAWLQDDSVSFLFFSLVLMILATGMLLILKNQELRHSSEKNFDTHVETHHRRFIRRMALGALILYLPVMIYLIYSGESLLIAVGLCLQAFHLTLYLAVGKIKTQILELGIGIFGYALMACLIYLFAGAYLLILAIVAVFIVNSYLIRASYWHVVNLVMALLCLGASYMFKGWNPDSQMLVETWGLEPIGAAMTMFIIAATLYFYQLRIRNFETVITTDNELLRRETQDLNASLALLQATLESTADGILVVDLTGKYISYNQRFKEIWRIPEEILERNESEITLAYVMDQLAEPDCFLASVRALYAQPETVSRDIVRFRDGRILERYSQPHRIVNQIVGRVWSFRDVTERVQVEGQLRTSEKRFRALFENAIDGILVYDLDSQAFVDCNQEACAIFDLYREQLLGTHMRDLFHRLRPDQVSGSPEELLLATSHSGKSLRFEAELLQKDGQTPIDIEVTFIPNREQASELMLMIKDISAQKRAEKALRRSEARSKQLIESSPSGISIADLNGNLVYISPRSTEIFQSESKAVIGKNLLDSLHPNERERAQLAMQELLISHEPVQDQFAAIRGDGSVFHVECKAVLLFDSLGNPEQIMMVFNDISERVIATQKLKASEREFKTLVESCPSGIIKLRPDATQVYISPRNKEIFGYEPENILGTSILEFIDPTYHPLVIESIEDLYSGREDIVRECVKVYRNDGTAIYVEGIARLLYDSTGNPEDVLLICNDISEKIRAEEALQKSRKAYQLLYENMFDGIMVYDYLEDQVVACNDAARELFGFEPNEDLSIHTRFSLIPQFSRYSGEVDLHKYTNGHKEKVLAGEKLRSHGIFQRNDGSIFLADVNVIPTHQRRGEGFVIIHDTTKDVLRKNALEAGEKKYRNIFDNSHQAIFLFDLEKMRPIDCNEVAVRMFGCETKEQFMTEPPRTFTGQQQFNGVDVETFIQQKIEEVTTKGRAEYRSIARRLNGEEFINEVTIVSDFSDDKRHILFFASDITEKFRQQEIINQQLKDLNRQNIELQRYIESNMQLENFAYMASHDLKAPIRTIVSFSQLLDRKAGEKLNKQEREYLDFIVSASMNMHRLINDLLAYSRVNTNQHQPEPIQLPDLLEEVLAELSSQLTERQAKVSIENIPYEIVGDATKIRQLFQNLILNACKFQRPGIAPSVTITCDERENYWQFSVIDNGIGIKKEFFQKIFLLFRKLHSVDQYEGTGIGLAICKKIVQQHGGEIWVESELGKGSTFFVTIEKKVAYSSSPRTLSRA